MSVPLVWTPPPAVAAILEEAERRRGRTQARATVGRHAIALPVAAPPRLDPPTPPEAPDPPPRSESPGVPIESGLQELVGAVSEVRPIGLLTRGPRRGSGCRWRTWTGIGRGDGRRLATTTAPGAPRASLTPGNGVTWPRLVRRSSRTTRPTRCVRRLKGWSSSRSRSRRWLGRPHQHRPIARRAVRTRSGSHQRRPPLALRSRPPVGQGRRHARRRRAVVQSALTNAGHRT